MADGAPGFPNPTGARPSLRLCTAALPGRAAGARPHTLPAPNLGRVSCPAALSARAAAGSASSRSPVRNTKAGAAGSFPGQSRAGGAHSPLRARRADMPAVPAAAPRQPPPRAGGPRMPRARRPRGCRGRLPPLAGSSGALPGGSSSSSSSRMGEAGAARGAERPPLGTGQEPSQSDFWVGQMSSIHLVKINPFF